eukprot:c15005_g1_i1.p1 GENE.c15005_g1_i1~~c15005_g1_i1.p1  ORF type:complete len:148 (-),score=28.71 c15005_g1_i1:77-520(-)
MGIFYSSSIILVIFSFYFHKSAHSQNRNMSDYPEEDPPSPIQSLTESPSISPSAYPYPSIASTPSPFLSSSPSSDNYEIKKEFGAIFLTACLAGLIIFFIRHKRRAIKARIISIVRHTQNLFWAPVVFVFPQTQSPNSSAVVSTGQP